MQHRVRDHMEGCMHHVLAEAVNAAGRGLAPFRDHGIRRGGHHRPVLQKLVVPEQRRRDGPLPPPVPNRLLPICPTRKLHIVEHPELLDFLPPDEWLPEVV